MHKIIYKCPRDALCCTRLLTDAVYRRAVATFTECVYTVQACWPKKY